jgi:hypothetical protein
MFQVVDKNKVAETGQSPLKILSAKRNLDHNQIFNQAEAKIPVKEPHLFKMQGTYAQATAAKRSSLVQNLSPN